MKFATIEEVNAFATEIETIYLTEKEENIVLREFGNVLSRENIINFVFLIEKTFFFGYAERYLHDRRVFAKVDIFEQLKKIDQKIGLFNNEDVLCVALFFFAYEFLDKHFKVSFTICKRLPYNLFFSIQRNFPSINYYPFIMLI